MNSDDLQKIIPSKKRFFVGALEKAAQEQGIGTHWMSGDWVCRLSRGGRHEFVYGYTFPLNSAAAWEIARDKTAVSLLLTNNNIPCAKHELFMAPSVAAYARAGGHEKAVSSLAAAWGFPIVCKDNRGAGGNMVHLARNRHQLEDALASVWSLSRSAALSPFYDIENEYRFFVLDGEIQFAYKKSVPTVVGDGIRSVAELVRAHFDTEGALKKITDPQNANAGDPAFVPAKGEAYPVGWKFNLSIGATAEPVETSSVPGHVLETVTAAAAELKLRVCSVDVIKLRDKDEYMVLEVNTSISAEHFVRTSPEAAGMLEHLYARILEKMFV